jgi:polyhydroxybutyrate depolymerase
MVVALHGGLGSADQFADNSRFEDLAEAEGFIVVFPDGVDRTWNAGACCGPAVRKGIDDVGFLAALIEHLGGTLPVNRERVFVTGHSNGAMMTFRFACERSDVVAAAAPVAGSLEIPVCSPPGRGVDLFVIHGDSDRNHPLEGGEGTRSISGVSYVSMENSLRRWTTGFGCTGAPSTTVEGALTTTTWSGCSGGTTASLVVIAGADHPWPGGKAPARTTSLQGVASQELDATRAVWEFFASR